MLLAVSWSFIFNPASMINFLKRLFGGSAREKSAQQAPTGSFSATAIPSPQLSFGPEEGFLPYFTSFKGEEYEAGSLIGVFHYTETEAPNVLVHVVKKETTDHAAGHERSYLVLDTRNMAQETYEAIRKSADENLAHEPAFFSFVEDSDGKILIGHGADLACEMIMCSAHMRKAHEMLKAERILVSIARRGLMLVTAHSDDEEARQTFLDMHWGVWKGWKAPDHEVITDDVFVLRNGALESVFYLNLEEEVQ